jgi:hypothetical protein
MLTRPKWLLFLTGDSRINGTWKTIARAVATGQLGPAAKIGTDDGGDSKSGRLICVYTKDFADVEDVERVLCKLVDLELVKEDAKQSIYYKCGQFLVEYVYIRLSLSPRCLYTSRHCLEE